MLTLTACASGRVAPPRVFWPLDDGEPRLEFIGNIHSDLDLVPVVERNLAMARLLGKRAEIVLRRPFSITPLEPGVVLVTDPKLGAIFRFDFNRRRATRFSQFFSGEAMGIDTDASGNVYVANAARARIHVFNQQGQPLAVIGGGDELERPSHLVVNRKLNRVYVADAPRHRIVVYNADGRHLFNIGQPGSGPGEFAAPQGLAFDVQNRLFVADMLNSRVQVFDAEGRFLYKFGQQSTNYWDFENPRDLAFASDGTLYIVDHRKALLLAYQPDGQFLFALGQGRPTAHPWGFSTPTAVCIASDDALYVTEQMNERFSKWQVLNGAYLAAHPLSGADQENLTKAREKYRRKLKGGFN